MSFDPKSSILFLLLWLTLAHGIEAQDFTTNTLISNYNSKHFIGASNSNFQITADLYGNIYSGNLNNTLKFDGNKWVTLEKEDVIVTSLFYSKKNELLFYGVKDDFGYYAPDKWGVLSAHSLQKKNNIKDLGLVWSINESANNNLNLHTSTGLYEFNENQLNKTSDDFSRYFEVDGQSLFVENGYLRNSDTLDSIPILNRPSFSNTIKLITGRTDSLHFITSTGSTFYLQNSAIQNSNLSNYILNSNIYMGKTIGRNTHALGYINAGLQIIDKFNLVYDRKSGLNGLFVKDAFMDNQSNVWIAMQEGVAKIPHYSPIEKLKLPDQIEPTSSVLVDNSIFVGSTSGVIRIDNQGQAESLFSDVIYGLSNKEDYTFAAGREGFYIVNEKETIYDRLVTNVSIFQDSLIFTGSGSGFTIYFIDNLTNLKELKKAKNPRLTYTDAILINKKIWVGSKSSGLFKWDLESNIIEQYSTPNNFTNIFYLKPVIINNSVYAFAPDGLYHYEESLDGFNKYFSYHNLISYAFQDENNRFIISSKNRFGDMELEIIEITNNGYKVISKELNGFDHSSVTHINKDEVGNYWFSTPEGLFKYDVKKAEEFNYQIGFNTLVNKVSSYDSLIFGGYYAVNTDNLPRMVLDQPKPYMPSLSYAQNALKFEFGAPYFTQNDKMQFSYYLEGNEVAWSSWNKERVKEYNNLSPGTYTFYVKSKNVFDVIGRAASYTFTILPPWYMTAWAYGLFTLGGLGLVWFIVLGYSYRVRQQRKNLKLVVADRTFEVLSQKKEIEKQNKQLQEQYEKILQQRDFINEKNQELEMSQEEILSINEQLHRLNQSLEKKVDERTSKIKHTVRKLQRTISELDTFIYRASHDLKGPISRINGLTSLAKLESSSPQDSKYYDLINLVAKDMNTLLAKLTQVHEVINSEVTLEVIDLPSLISRVRESISFVDRENTTRYSFDLGKVLGIKSDLFLITIIFTNIIENSLIFKKPKQVDHELFIKSSEDEENYYLYFKDNGIGINTEHIKKVFDMFYKGSDKSKGSGLGLYLTKMAVEKLDGEINIESEFEKYTKVIITLPKV